MKTFKFLTLLILGLLIFGSATYFAYELFIKPGRIEKVEKLTKAAATTPIPGPDPGAHELQRLKSLQAGGDAVAARDGLKTWIETHPKSPLLKDARNQLGQANMSLLFQPSSNPSVVTYTVLKGDSLAKIATKHKSNAELIQRANNLPGIGLQIGQQLVIPVLTPSLELDRAEKTMVLLDNAAFVKQYTLLSSPTAPVKPVPPITTKVLDKIATAGTKRVAFGDKTYTQSERMILLSGNSSIVGFDLPPQSSTSNTVTSSISTNSSVTGSTNAPLPPSPAANPAQLPPGYVLSKEDLLEIFPLVSRNTPVIIH
jgi:LysM repeat protein